MDNVDWFKSRKSTERRARFLRPGARFRDGRGTYCQWRGIADKKSPMYSRVLIITFFNFVLGSFALALVKLQRVKAFF